MLGTVGFRILVFQLSSYTLTNNTMSFTIGRNPCTGRQANTTIYEAPGDIGSIARFDTRHHRVARNDSNEQYPSEDQVSVY